MSPLVPCTACERHVRASDPLCPFCGSALPVRSEAPRTVRIPRLGRAAIAAFGAATAFTVTSCGGTPAQPYGAPPAEDTSSDTGGGEELGGTDAGAPDAGAPDAGEADVDPVAPAYGGPPSP